MSYSGMLNTTCSIYRRGTLEYPTSNYGSVSDEDWTLVASGVRCRVNRGATYTSRRSDGIVETGTRMLFLEVDADIEDDDRVEVGGKYYGVRDVESIPGMHDDHHIEATIFVIDWEAS